MFLKKKPTTTNHQPPILLIGLGNPGISYAGNRHNVGFMAADAIRAEYGFGRESAKFGGALSEGIIVGAKVLSFKPMGYMNLSGEPAQKLIHFYKIPLSHIIVFHDELDLQLAKIRVKIGGGNGGHNGLKSLDANLSADYKRVRIGIGHPGDKELVHDHVLSDFSKAEMKTIAPLCNNIAAHIALLLQGDDAGFMNKLATSQDEK